MGNVVKAKITYSVLGDLLSIWTLVNRFTLENASATLLPHFRHPIDKDDVVGASTSAGGLAK